MHIEVVTEGQLKVNSSSSSFNLVVNEFDLPSSVQKLIDKYLSVISPHNITNKEYCGIYCRICAVFAKPRKLLGQKLEDVQVEVKNLLNTGVIGPSSKEWSSPLHLVQKLDGSYRACGNIRAIVSITKTDRYPIPNIYIYLMY